MQNHEWAKEYPGAITVCDPAGIILYMNDKAQTVFSGGGKSLVGQNVLVCHPEPARSKLAAMLESGKSNTYTIEKNGIKKLIHQTPWYQEGTYSGFVELSIEIPHELPHFVRTPKTTP